MRFTRSRKRVCKTRVRKTRYHKQRGGNRLTVRFAEGLASRDAPLYSAKDMPAVSWPAQSNPVTFLCWDPDAPQASWLHWMVINCTGVGPESGTTVVPWAPPTPPSGTHRYMFAIFSSPAPIAPPVLGRPNFDPAAFAAKNDLKQLDWVAIKVKANMPTVVM